MAAAVPKERNESLQEELAQVARFAEKLEQEPPEAILQWAYQRYHPRLVLVSNYGPSTVLIVHYLAELALDVPVLHIDTGLEFPETAEVGRALEKRYGITIQKIRPELSLSEQAERYGPKLYRRDPDLCCYLRKVLPLQKALSPYDAWITGVRRSQSATRRQVQVVEWDPRHQMVKVNPLARWTSEQVWEAVRRHQVPYNPLHDQGYPSIGCAPCTQPVTDPNADERAGRWSGLEKTECGIHLYHI